ncbi:MAG: Asp-tRNA(Asn)/Glu-tRNA(Gln) amidotransferase GatCAB subunit A [Elusimicrobia bacterium HGW-Elusimicrobia-1]|jgi:aspartyl-tRNA(Asn)/glutamyl-tRNA(Gln) amidotransferase subunit A|nr:MAG: Asp-tRNA(Asn)/Glu-tRNA(Gln) amidotransferase GatCAB subunit A [Elusimicrobia bacterium HGW-Elusimicrobia-1]
MTEKKDIKTIAGARNALISRETTAVSLLEPYLSRIERLDDKIKSFIITVPDRARAKAAAIDAKIARGETPGRLAGTVVAVKDNINISGLPTTCGSKILKNYIAPYDATVVEKLEREDALIIGKTNLDEFAMGSSTENSAFFPTRNPWDVERVPGGSSGGSAAAVAAGMSQVSLGSDTGGSIRQPAAFCGVVGVKPTYGAVSRYGLVAFASSLDQIGPFARNVDDAAAVLSAVSGRDPRDSTSADVSFNGLDALRPVSLGGIKIGLPAEYFVKGAMDAEVVEAVEKTVDAMAKAGAEVKKISLPRTQYAVATYYIVAPSEASSNLARFDGVKYGLSVGDGGLIDSCKETREEGFGPEVKRRIMLGTYALSSGYYDAYYLAAQKVRSLIAEDFRRAFLEVDFIVSPVTTSAAFKIGERISDPLSMYLADIFTISVNLAGIPAVSVPCDAGKTSGLPVGIQIMAPHFADERMLGFAKSLEDLVQFKPLKV